jgi:hypothetical protein
MMDLAARAIHGAIWLILAICEATGALVIAGGIICAAYKLAGMIQ